MKAFLMRVSFFFLALGFCALITISSEAVPPDSSAGSSSGASQVLQAVPRLLQGLAPQVLSRGNAGSGRVSPPNWAMRYEGFFPSVPGWIEWDVPVAVVSPGDGRIMVAATVSHVSTMAGNSIDNILVMGVDPSGGLAWKVLYPPDPYRKCSYIARTMIGTRDGGFLVLGTRQDTIGDPRPLLMKLNIDGTVAWVRSYQLIGGWSTYAAGLAELADGRYAVASSAWDKSGPLLWSLIVDPAGNVLWSECLKTPKGNGETIGRSVRASSDGGFILAGASAYGNAELIKYGPAGAREWQASLIDEMRDGFQTACEIMNVALTQDGGYFLAGTTRFFNDQMASIESWLAKVDGTGNLVWQEGLWLGSDMENMVATSDGGFLYCGPYVSKFDAQGQLGDQRACWTSNFVAALPYAPSGHVLAGVEPVDTGPDLKFKINLFLTNENMVLDDNCVTIYVGSINIRDWQLRGVSATPLTVAGHDVRSEVLPFVPSSRTEEASLICGQDKTGSAIRNER